MKEKIEFEQIVEKNCGLDVHKENGIAIIKGKGITTQTRSFSTLSRSLISLREWLLKHGTTVSNMRPDSPNSF